MINMFIVFIINCKSIDIYSDYLIACTCVLYTISMRSSYLDVEYCTVTHIIIN